MQIDYCVVGSGLAGTMLADSLFRKGFSVRLFSGSRTGEASKVSSGVVKPVTGRKFVKTWRFDQLYSHALTCYRELEVRFQLELVQVLDIYVELTGAAQENDWRARMLDDHYIPWMGIGDKKDLLSSFSANDIPIGLIRNGLKVNVPLITESLLEFLNREGLVKFEDFEYQSLYFDLENWRYHEERYRKIIFCEGYRGIHNPFLKSFRLTPLKGECIFVHSDHVPDYIFQSKYSVVPSAKETLWIGSNYNLKDTSATVTDTEIGNQLDFANQILLPAWILVRKDFGFRSTSSDRRPIIGPVKNHQGLYVFNGFGTKGASLIPYCRDMLMDHLLHGSLIDPEVSASRYSS